MDRTLCLEFVRATEAAAIAAGRWIGRGDKHAADQAAVTAMREMFSSIPINGRVVIGEGERDEAPMLYIGEEIGTKEGPEIEIAVDPLEGTNITAAGGWNSMAVLAAAPKGCLLHAPDTYMDKIAVGPCATGAVDLDAGVKYNIESVAKALDKKPEDLLIVVLDRDRHTDLIKDIRALGARIKLIGDGDIAGGIAPCIEHSGVDMLMGIGAAPEGVITAAALKAYGGEIQGRLKFRSDEEQARAKTMGIEDPERKYSQDDLVQGNKSMFVATGVTDGTIAKGVVYTGEGAETESLVIRESTKTIRRIHALHNFKHRPK